MRLGRRLLYVRLSILLKTRPWNENDLLDSPHAPLEQAYLTYKIFMVIIRLI